MVNHKDDLYLEETPAKAGETPEQLQLIGDALVEVKPSYHTLDQHLEVPLLSQDELHKQNSSSIDRMNEDEDCVSNKDDHDSATIILTEPGGSNDQLPSQNDDQEHEKCTSTEITPESSSLLSTEVSFEESMISTIDYSPRSGLQSRDEVYSEDNYQESKEISEESPPCCLTAATNHQQTSNELQNVTNELEDSVAESSQIEECHSNLDNTWCVIDVCTNTKETEIMEEVYVNEQGMENIEKDHEESVGKHEYPIKVDGNNILGPTAFVSDSFDIIYSHSTWKVLRYNISTSSFLVYSDSEYMNINALLPCLSESMMTEVEDDGCVEREIIAQEEMKYDRDKQEITTKADPCYVLLAALEKHEIKNENCSSIDFYCTAPKTVFEAMDEDEFESGLDLSITIDRDCEVIPCAVQCRYDPSGSVNVT